MTISRPSKAILALVKDAVLLFWGLLKVMVPVMVAIRIATEAGMVELLAPVFSPFMAFMGLPAEMGIVWTTGVLIGKWGAGGAFVALLPTVDLSIAQASVLWATILISHAIPLEQAVVRKAGGSFFVTSFLRVGGGLVYGSLLSVFYRATEWLEEPLSLSWLPNMSTAQTWLEWFWNWALSLGILFWILLGLVILLKVMDELGITRMLTRMVSPLMGLMRIEKEAAPMVVVGVLLGIAYGGGLIIREAQSGRLSAHTVFLSLCFMGFCHGVIEDTAIAMTFGCHYSAAIIGRILFTLAAMMTLGWVVKAMPDHIFLRFFFKPGALGRRG